MFVKLSGAWALTLALFVAGGAPRCHGGDIQPPREPLGRVKLQLHKVEKEPDHHETYQRRRLLSLDSDGSPSEVVPLNPGLGTHYTWVYAGTPPQRASVITDTGSSIMAFPCSGCTGCGKHTDQPFAAAQSSSLSHVTCDAPSFFRCSGCQDGNVCGISQSYMEGSSWRATVVEDVVYLGGDDSAQDASLRQGFSTRFMFGCQTTETGLFITQVADGIMGLANNDNHIIAKLHREKKIREKQFALCFAPEGGSMTIGELDTSRHHGEVKYAKLIQTKLHDFYAVQFRDIRVGDVSVQADPSIYRRGHFIVDSGTTDSYLPRALKQSFEHAFEQATGLQYRTSTASCKGFSDAELDRLPNITYVLEGENGQDMLLSITPSQYLLEEKDHTYCANIFLSESSGGVIGANIMMDRDVVFDGDRQRVGYVGADCSYRQLTRDSTSASPSPSLTSDGNISSPDDAAHASSTPLPQVTPLASSHRPASPIPQSSMNESNSTTVPKQTNSSDESRSSNQPSTVPHAGGSNESAENSSSGDSGSSRANGSNTTGLLQPSPPPSDESATTPVPPPPRSSFPSDQPSVVPSSSPASSPLPDEPVKMDSNETSSTTKPVQNHENSSASPYPMPSTGVVRSTPAPTPPSAGSTVSEGVHGPGVEVDDSSSSSSSVRGNPTPSLSATSMPSPTTQSDNTSHKPTATNTSHDASSDGTVSKTEKHSNQAEGDQTSEDHPLVLTIVGTVLALAFLSGVVFACRRHKAPSKQKWSRVNEIEDDDEELGLAVASDSNSIGLRNPVRSSDVVESDDDDDEDEIFDRTVQDREDLKHDTTVLEQL